MSKRKNPAEQELADYNDLMTWINEEADEVLQIVDQPVTERQQEYMVRLKLFYDINPIVHTEKAFLFLDTNFRVSYKMH